MQQKNIEERTSYDFENQISKYFKEGYIIYTTTIEIKQNFSFRYKAILRKI